MTDKQIQDQIYDEFQKELQINDKLAKEEMSKKTHRQMVEEYNKFAKDNNCKTKAPQKRKGGKK